MLQPYTNEANFGQLGISIALGRLLKVKVLFSGPLQAFAWPRRTLQVVTLPHYVGRHFFPWCYLSPRFLFRSSHFTRFVTIRREGIFFKISVQSRVLCGALLATTTKNKSCYTLFAPLEFDTCSSGRQVVLGCRG